MAHKFVIEQNKAGEYAAKFKYNSEVISWTEGYSSKAGAELDRFDQEERTGRGCRRLMSRRKLSPMVYPLNQAIAAGALLMAGGAAAQTSAPISACQLSAERESLIGKSVRVHGYLVDLGSHGFVLVAEKSCENDGQIQVYRNRVFQQPAWREAFDYNPNPREVVLSGTMVWGETRLGAKVPVFDIAVVESISKREVPFSEIK